MEFCPECGGMLLPDGDKLKCGTCGYEKDASNKDTEQFNVSEKIQSKNNVVDLGNEVDVRPTTNVLCPECGNNKAYFKLLQTRSADEAPTRIYTCVKCKHSWREYD